jgi:hypothetical protein
VKDDTLTRGGIAGAALIALCCLGFTLAPLLGLSAWLGWAGYVVLPVLIALAGIAVLGVLYLRRSSGADTACCDAEPSKPRGMQR